MARPQSRFVCQACGEAFLRWEGQCRGCGGWNTLVETLVRERPAGARRSAVAPPSAGPMPLGTLTELDVPRLPVGLAELDRVLGGGIVPGSLALVGGEPGIGKSTLLLQAAAGLAGAGAPVLYATGEESGGQVHLRARRLGLIGTPAADAVHLLAEHDVGRIVEAARGLRPAAVIVDSIQTATLEELDGPAGSVGQVRESALRLMELAKGDGIAVVLVGHVTKEGSLAGPKTLEHLVDAVVSIEGERGGTLRLVRASKNRFGATDEVGVLEMVESGLREVSDPARAFLVDARGARTGECRRGDARGEPGAARRGPGARRRDLLRHAPADRDRPRPQPARPARGGSGRRAGVGLVSHDVYANLAGGISVVDPGLDLPLAIALSSTLRDRAVRTGTVAFGEVGLLGELRGVAGTERRLREAARLGFSRAIVPRARGAGPTVEGLEVVAVATVREALGAALAAADG